MTLRIAWADNVAVAGLLAVLAALWLAGWAVPQTLLAHVVVVLVFCGLATALGRPFLQLAGVLSLGTGPFGALIALVLAIGLRLATLDPARHTDWYRLLSGALHDAPGRTRAQDIAAGRTLPRQMPPRDLAAIFATGTRTEKRAALRWMRQQKRGDFAAELRRAMDDADAAIRIEAAALYGRPDDPVDSR